MTEFCDFENIWNKLEIELCEEQFLSNFILMISNKRALRTRSILKSS